MFPWSKPKVSPEPDTRFLVWTEDLRIGNHGFDQDHRAMVDAINQIHTLMVVERDRAKANQAVESLLQVTRGHFAREEGLLTEHGYPERESHFHEHSALLDEFRELHRQFKAGTLSALAMPTFLKKWLVEHIQKTDRLYVDFLKSKGVT